MKINIIQLQNSPNQQTDIVFQEIINELGADTKVYAEINIKKTHYGVNITGTVKADVKLQCDRCLEEYIYHVNTNINEDFVNDNIVKGTQKEHELKEGEFVEELQGKDEIDITDFLYQIIILEIPMQKICSTSCIIPEDKEKSISEKNIDERLEVFKYFSENNYKS